MNELAKFSRTYIEGSTPTLSRGFVPEALLAIALISPDREKAISTYIERIGVRQQQRAHEFEQDVLDAANVSPEELLQRLLNDDAASQLFGQAVIEAIHTAEKLKRHALARAVASGLLSEDEAVIDIVNLHVRTIAALEVVHIRMLLAIISMQEAVQRGYRQELLKRNEQDRARGKEISYPDKKIEEILEARGFPDVPYSQVMAALKWSGGALGPLLTELAQRDLITGWSPGSPSIGVSPFGMSLIAFLRDDAKPA